MAAALRCIAAACCACSVALVPATALASPLFELIGASLGTGGFNARATGRNAASAYYNPALLPKARQGFELGWVAVHDSVNITLDARSPAANVPESAVDRTGTDLPPYPTNWLERGCEADSGECVTPLAARPRQGDGSSGGTRAYQAVGLVNHLVDKYLSLGMYALIPLNTFTRAHSFFVDEREQYFSNSLHPEMYGDRLTPVSLAFGAGSQLAPWISFGFSFTLGLTNSADASAYVGNSGRLSDTLQLSTKVDVTASVSPHFGLMIEPIDGLDLSLTLHSPQKLEINTGLGIYLPNGDAQYADRPSTHGFLPWIVGVGAAYDVYRTAHQTWSLTTTTTFERWSRYLNRQTERPRGDYAFSDTFNTSAGVRYTRTQGLSAFGDVTYHPTPVPPQTGRTNYVDSDRYGLMGGVQYELPVPSWGVAFRFGAQGQVQLLADRHQTKRDPSRENAPDGTRRQWVVDEWPDGTKDVATGEEIKEARGLQTNNPGWPGFRSSGVLAGGALSVALLY